MNPNPIKGIPFRPNEVAEVNHRLNSENSRVCLAGMYGPWARIGVRSFLVFMEYRHFPPHIPDMNRRYEMCLVKFTQFIFAVVIFPRRYLDTADALLKTLGLKRAGVPVAAKVTDKFYIQASTRRTGLVFEQYKRTTGLNWEMFPFNGPNVFALENLGQHFTYDNNREEYEKAMQAEDEAIKREIETYETVFARQIAKVREGK